MPPNAAMNSSATTDAPVTGRRRNSSRSISGLRAARHVQQRTGPAATAPANSALTVLASPQPQLPASTSPSTSVPTPPVMRIAPSGSGADTGWPGTCGSRRQPTISASSPDGDVDEEHPAPAGRHQQPADDRPGGGRDASHRGPRPDGAVTALGRERGQDQAQRGRSQQRGPGRLDDPEGDQHRQARGQPAGGGGADEDATPSRKAWSRR